MGLLDKLLGREKKATGDTTGDAPMRSEGMQQEAQGVAEDQAPQYEGMAHEGMGQAEHEDAAQPAAEHDTENEM